MRRFLFVLEGRSTLFAIELCHVGTCLQYFWEQKRHFVLLP